MPTNNFFTPALCVQQALICYLNSCIFKNLHLFGPMHKMMLISNFGEILNNLIRAGSMIMFKYISYHAMFIINTTSAIILFLNTLLFTYALYDHQNVVICAISWTINRICNSINASCRDSMLYTMNKKYNLNINIPIVKTIKALGNIFLLIKILTITSSIYFVPMIYVHLGICMFVSILNVIACMFLHYISYKLHNDSPEISSDLFNEMADKPEEQERKLNELNITNLTSNLQNPRSQTNSTHHTQPTQQPATETWRVIINNSLKLLVITILINIAQVDDALIFYKISNSNTVFILKQCIGQIGLGLIYSLIFKNSKAILIAAPLVPLIFHQLSIYNMNYIGAMVMGLQYMLKNTTYLLLSLIMCNYSFIYPAICIVADAISIGISNALFLIIATYYNEHIAHIVFRNLGILAVIFGGLLWMASATSVKTKIIEEKEINK